MKRHGTGRILIAASALLVALVLGPAALPDGTDEIAWGEDLSAALKTAATDERPVMVDVWAVWCIPCKEMEETTYRDREVLRAAAEFVPLKVDADVKTAFVERYRVDAFPTLLFLDADGAEITRWRGAIAAGPLTDLLDRLGEGYPRYLETGARPADPAAAREVADYLTDVGNAGGAVDLLRSAIKSLRGGEASVLEKLELRLGEAHLDAEEPKAAAKIFRRLADEATDSEVRGQALVGLVRAERARGRDAQADEALARLRAEHPGLAESSGL